MSSAIPLLLHLAGCFLLDREPLPACDEPHLWYAPDASGDVYFGCQPPGGWLRSPPDELAFATSTTPGPDPVIPTEDTPSDTGGGVTDTDTVEPPPTDTSRPPDTHTGDTGADTAGDTGADDTSDTGALEPEDTGAPLPEDTSALPPPEDTGGGPADTSDTGAPPPQDTSDTGAAPPPQETGALPEGPQDTAAPPPPPGGGDDTGAPQ